MAAIPNERSRFSTCKFPWRRSFRTFIQFIIEENQTSCGFHCPATCRKYSRATKNVQSEWGFWQTATKGNIYIYITTILVWLCSFANKNNIYLQGSNFCIRKTIIAHWNIKTCHNLYWFHVRNFGDRTSEPRTTSKFRDLHSSRPSHSSSSSSSTTSTWFYI